jgi:hypothetical protein
MATKRFLSPVCFRTAVTLALLALFSPLMRAQAQAPLNYFKNYFVTGDYAVGGVGLANVKPVAGSVSSTINFSGVPCTSGPGFNASVVPCTSNGAQPADVIAAFLYWQTNETTETPSSANGSFDGSANAFTGIALGNPTVAACSGGGTGSEYMHVYRADVLRYLPINTTANVRVANGAQTFTLTSTSPATQFVGATLVVVYRLVTPGNPRIAPLRAVVIYDGAYTGTPTAGLNQPMGGFFQAAEVLPSNAKMTHIVGNGLKTSRETLTVNGSIPSGVSNPFEGAQGTNWDNYTFNYNLAPNASSVDTSVVLNQGCLYWAAIVTSTNVQDSDFDGLLDIWETSGLYFNPGVRYDGVTPLASPAPAPATFGTCTTNPTGCLNLPKMGANWLVPDIFVQVDWMYDLNTTSNTDGTPPNPPHSHNPQFAALKMVGDVFKAHGINLHFDVGSDNPLSPYCQAANSTTIGPCNYQSQNSPYIIPAAYAHGGNAVDESGNLLCPNAVTGSNCAFPYQSNLYSVLGWKFGFDAIRDGDPVLLKLPQLFPQDEKDAVHYALFGHAIAATTPLSTPEAGSISGVADHPGGDILVTLGLWRSSVGSVDEVGTLLDQAGTLMHELGHNLGLSHGGWYDTPTCMPDYPSVMNYLYQVAGLTDAQGNEHLDYSYGLLLPLAENNLSVKIPMGLQTYRVRYFGPFNPNNKNPLPNTPTTPSKAFCSGGYPTEGAPYVRLEWPSISTPDWSNGTVASGSKLSPLDINYDGTASGIITNETFTDSPDWLSINLQQVSARAGADGFSTNLGLSQIGLSQIGLSQIGLSQIGLSQIGLSQIGLSQIGISDAGTAALGQDALGTGGDQDQASFVLSGGSLPPTGLAPSVSTANDPNTGWTSTQYPGGTGIALNWTPSTTGVASSYNIYVCNATTNSSCIPTTPFLASASGAAPNFTLPVNDFTHSGTTCPTTPTISICYNTPYNIYVTEVFLVANVAPLPESGYSNTVTGEVNHIFAMGNISPTSVTYGTANPPITMNTYPTATALAGSNAGCVYTTTPVNVVGSPYTITCTGPSVWPAGGTVGVTYNTPYLTFTPSTLSITTRPVTATLTAQNKPYDGTTTEPSSNMSCSLSNALPADVQNNYVTCVPSNGTFNTSQVATANTVSATASLGGSAATNYTFGAGGVVPAVTSTSLTATPVKITPAPLTVTANNLSKPYGMTFTFAGTEFATNPSPLYSTDTVTSVTLTSAGTPANATVAGSTYPIVPSAAVGSGLTNYTITYMNGSLTVKPAPLAITASSANVNYGATAPTITPSYNSFVNSESSSVLSPQPTCSTTYAKGSPVSGSPYSTSCSGAVDSNYTISYVPGVVTVNPVPLTITASSGAVTYGSPAIIMAGYSGFVSNDGAGSLTTPPSCGTTYTQGSPVPGPYTTACMGAMDSNYTISYIPGALTVIPFPLTVTAAGVNKNFDGTTNATVTFMDNSFAADAGQFTYSYSASFANIGPGTGIQVTVTNLSLTGAASGNYSIGTVNSFPFVSGNPIEVTANISDSITLSALSLSGTNYGSNTPAPPTWTGSALQLIDGVGTTTVSAWLPTAISISTAFSTTFKFQIPQESTGPNSIADGFAFVIQGSPTGKTTLGTTGMGGFIGYAGITNSLAIEFDTYYNSGTGFDDPTPAENLPYAAHIGIQSLGTQANSPDHTVAGLSTPQLATFDDGGSHTATITYDGSLTISVSLDGTTVVSATLQKPLGSFLGLTSGTAYIGFTAATGGSTETSDITSWTWDYTGN